AAADPAALLRGAGRGAAGVLAKARDPPRAHGLRADSPRLRDLDGGEARSRFGVDRGSLGAALPAHARGDRLASPWPVPPRTPRRLDVEARVLEVEVTPNTVDDVAADRPRTPEGHDGVALGVEQLAAQSLIVLRLRLDRSVVLRIEA